MIRSQSRRNALRVGLTGSVKRRPRLCAGSEAKTARSRPVSTAIAALTSLARALNYPLGLLPIGWSEKAGNEHEHYGQRTGSAADRRHPQRRADWHHAARQRGRRRLLRLSIQIRYGKI